ncbi:hypothetical protein PLICRDRAFT_33393 [Plicaturopsis crispa FD-325 SS-3]|nr:hypothetical protein PLICRDRAFT_33393 [Plicaturopsis crispa FD-325 SS-3]
MPQYWLMKAEPDSRIVKGKDVKFSVDDFESAKTTSWEGVRNHEAKNLMKSMKIGDKVLFYHSNCKSPGVAGFAEISKEAHPDYTAWDSEHPYYDAKSDKDNPKWFMVDATFVARAAHFVPLALLRHVADATTGDPPEEIEYIGKDGVKSIKGMALVNRGHLSVQRVEEDAWNVVQQLAEKGGWDDMNFGKTKGKAAAKKMTKKADKETESKSKGKNDEEADEPEAAAAGGRKRKATDVQEETPQRRSTRRKVEPRS